MHTHTHTLTHTDLNSWPLKAVSHSSMFLETEWTYTCRHPRIYECSDRHIPSRRQTQTQICSGHLLKASFVSPPHTVYVTVYVTQLLRQLYIYVHYITASVQLRWTYIKACSDRLHSQRHTHTHTPKKHKWHLRSRIASKICCELQLPHLWFTPSEMHASVEHEHTSQKPALSPDIHLFLAPISSYV